MIPPLMDRRRPAVEPFWPWGAVAWLIIRSDGQKRAEWYEVRRVTKIEGGWEVIAGRENQSTDYAFEVDENGESAMCVPWDDEIDRQFDQYHELRLGPLRMIDELAARDDGRGQDGSVDWIINGHDHNSPGNGGGR